MTSTATHMGARSHRVREGRLEAFHAPRLSRRVADPQGLALAVLYPIRWHGSSRKSPNPIKLTQEPESH